MSSVHMYAKVNNTGMKDYDSSTASSCLMHWGMKKLYWLPMSQKLPVDGFELKKKKSRFLRNVCNTMMITTTNAYFILLSNHFHMKSDNIYADLVGNFKKRFDTSNYEFKKPLHLGKYKKRSGWWKMN